MRDRNLIRRKHNPLYTKHRRVPTNYSKFCWKFCPARDKIFQPSDSCASLRRASVRARLNAGVSCGVNHIDACPHGSCGPGISGRK